MIAWWLAAAFLASAGAAVAIYRSLIRSLDAAIRSIPCTQSETC